MKKCVFCGKELVTNSDCFEHKCSVHEEHASPVRRRTVGDCVKALGRLLYVHNPFYIISAVLVLYGLDKVFDTSSETADGWILMGVLMAYTCLMALSALFIVRLGKVWEDARSILLIVLLLFLASSITFDELAIAKPSTGAALLIAGLVMAVSLSEVLLRGLRIKLRLLFRVPYHLILVLFFAYPLLLLHLLQNATRSSTLWGIYLYPVISSILFLLLLPAAWKGSSCVRNNGTPWRWPWFPWPMFAVLGLAVCLRSYSLSISFDPAEGMETVFGPYFLIPFALSASAILLEIGISSGKRWLQRIALAGPLLALAMPFFGQPSSPTYNEFANLLAETLVPITILGAVGAMVFYWYALARGVALAEAGLVLSLLVSSVVHTLPVHVRTHVVNTPILAAPRILPVLAISAIEILYALIRPSSWRVLISTFSLLGTCTVGLRNTGFVSWNGVLPIHLAYVNILVIGAAFRDRLGRFLQNAGAFLLPLFCLGAGVFAGPLLPNAPGWAVTGYLAAMIAMSLCYWRLVGNTLYLHAGLLGAGISGAGSVRWAYRSIREMSLPKGAGLLMLGGVTFVVAFFISFVKGNIPERISRSPSWVRIRDLISGSRSL